ncbi:MAG: DUF192 domain-containing protein [Chloroflexota bacterium]
MPRSISIQNLTRALSNPAAVGYCDSFLCRLRGLMFRPQLGVDEGLLLVEGRDSRIDSSIHMFFVPFDLAVFWIDSSLTVVDRVIARSWKPAYLPKQPARYILEIHPSRLEDYQIGDRVEFKDA